MSLCGLLKFAWEPTREEQGCKLKRTWLEGAEAVHGIAGLSVGRMAEAVHVLAGLSVGRFEAGQVLQHHYFSTLPC